MMMIQGESIRYMPQSRNGSCFFEGVEVGNASYHDHLKREVAAEEKEAEKIETRRDVT